MDKFDTGAHGMQEVVSSNLIGSISVSYAEFNTYEYLPSGGTAVTLIKKAYFTLFERRQDRDNYKNKNYNPKTSPPQSIRQGVCRTK